MSWVDAALEKFVKSMEWREAPLAVRNLVINNLRGFAICVENHQPSNLPTDVRHHGCPSIHDWGDKHDQEVPKFLHEHTHEDVAGKKVRYRCEACGSEINLYYD